MSFGGSAVKAKSYKTDNITILFYIIYSNQKIKLC